MDHRDPNYVPEGWIKTLKNNRVTFKTMPPRLNIQSKRMLLDYQKKNQFLEADAEKLDFRRLTKIGEIAGVSDRDDSMEIDVENEDRAMEVDVELEHQTCVTKLPPDQEKVREGTMRLESKSESPVNHSDELRRASEILAQVVADSSRLELNMNFVEFREDLLSSETTDDFIDALTGNQDLCQYFAVLGKAKVLSELINLPLSSTSPLVGWPTDVKENVYCEIIKLAHNEAREVLSFLCNVIVPKDQPIGKEEVIRVADMFSTLAHTVSKKQNALAKLKSVVLQCEGLSTPGLDRLSKLKGTECSTTLSRGRHLLVELGESTFRASAKQGKSFTITCDNLNLKHQNMM